MKLDLLFLTGILLINPLSAAVTLHDGTDGADPILTADTIGGVRFSLVADPFTSDPGTGTINPSLFALDVGGQPTVEMGHNTAASPVNNESKATNAHNDVTFAQLPIVSSGAVGPSFQIWLDINETGNDYRITLDRLMAFSSPTGNLVYDALANGHPSDGDLGTLRYDSGVNFDLNLISTRHGGDDKGDVEILFPVSMFDGVNTNDNLYLFAQFSNMGGGDEEFNVVTAIDGLPQLFLPPGTPIPEPSSAILLLLSGGFFFWRNR